MNARPSHPAARLGFSLMELIVVIILLAIVAGAVVPRLVAATGRQAETSMKNVSALLSIAAHRNAVGGDSLAVVRDGKANTLALETLRRGEGESTPSWKRDRFARPVELDELRIKRAAVDGKELNGDDWRIEFFPNEQRPIVELTLESDEGGKTRSWSITLLPYETAAKAQPISTTSATASTAALRSIDLDATGKGDSAW